MTSLESRVDNRAGPISRKYSHKQLGQSKIVSLSSLDDISIENSKKIAKIDLVFNQNDKKSVVFDAANNQLVPQN